MKIKLTFLDKNNNLIKTLNIKEKDLFTKKNKLKSILDIGLDNGIDIKYGCMGGSCSACKCKIEKGESFIEKEKLNKIIYKDVKEKEILSCIATIKNIEKNRNEEYNKNNSKEIIIKLLL